MVLNGNLSLTHSVLIATVPLFLLQLGAEPWLAGVSMAVYTFTALAFRPWFGRLLDTRGRRPVFLWGAALLGTGTLLLPVSLWLGVGPLLVLRAVQGVGFSALSNAGGTMVADLVPRERLTEGIGLFGLSFIAAGAVGPALGLGLGNWWSYPAVFLTMGALMAAVFVTASVGNLGKTWVPVPAPPGKPPFLEPAALGPAAVVLLTAIPWGAVMTFVPVYGTELGLSLGAVFFLVYSGAVLVSRLAVGRAADRHGPTGLLVAALTLAIVGMAVIASARDLPLFLFAAVLYGLGAGILQPLLMTLILTLCPPDRRGTANAMYYSSMDIGVGLGALAGGLVAQFFGLPAVFWAGVLSLSAGLVLSLITMRADAPRTAPRPRGPR